MPDLVRRLQLCAGRGLPMQFLSADNHDCLFGYAIAAMGCADYHEQAYDDDFVS